MEVLTRRWEIKLVFFIVGGWQLSITLALIAQLDRASVFETEGSRFESWWACYKAEWRSGYLVRLII